MTLRARALSVDLNNGLRYRDARKQSRTKSRKRDLEKVLGDPSSKLQATVLVIKSARLTVNNSFDGYDVCTKFTRLNALADDSVCDRGASYHDIVAQSVWTIVRQPCISQGDVC